MSEHDHKPVSLVGLLLLAAVALVFLAAVWLIGAAFAKSEPDLAMQNRWNRAGLTAFL